ncbi:flagellar biosynthesis repressor FlbT [Mesorhizobium xinjiangense]|uniref:flagellar biosynthesis repressor FlbT n=1 Tax=Mesorhizobium xinjiangense TaxID=2678685 RepID=UPI0012EDE7D7|nr:flagellar biosynthesis repressor FlbT [Mesorhizobium xinjiangense]
MKSPKSSLKISLKANEKIYINGAVVRVDRKTSIEFLNDVQFLLENHVLQAEQATTPLRQLYFIVQVILMSPGDASQARDMFRKSLSLLLANFSNEQILGTLKQVDRLVAEDQVYEALKMIRGLFAIEDEILGKRGRAAGGSTHQALEATAS